MPGFLMGLLQFGWLAVNASAVAAVLCIGFHIGLKSNGIDAAVPGWPHGVIAAVFAALAAFIGLKGIKYMARVATYLPLIPVLVLLILLAITCTGLPNLNIDKLVAPQMGVETVQPAAHWGDWHIVAILCIYIVGFFATAGAAGTDIASNSRSVEDVHIGGITGILLPTFLAGFVTMLIVAGAYNGNMVRADHLGNYNPVQLMPDILASRFGVKWAPTLRTSP